MKFEPIKSSFLQEAAHDGKDKVQVRIKGVLYEYPLPAEKFAEWQKNFQTEESSGKFFREHILPLKGKKVQE